MTPDLAEAAEKAKGLYLTLIGLTTGPPEAMNILCMIHLLLFLNHGDPDCSPEAMLDSYTKNFLRNWKANKAQAS